MNENKTFRNEILVLFDPYCEQKKRKWPLSATTFAVVVRNVQGRCLTLSHFHSQMLLMNPYTVSEKKIVGEKYICTDIDITAYIIGCI